MYEYSLTPGNGGQDGADGASAYEVAVANGFVGTEQDWLDSLVGAPGADGAPGAQGDPGTPGAQGDPGTPGDPGADGASAYEVAVANGFVGDEAAWLASLVGTPGVQGDPGVQGEPGLQGDPGPQGDPGTPGADGADALWNFTGEYNGGLIYTTGDVVTYNGQTWYRLIYGAAGHVPAEDTWWTLIAAKGAQGDQGIQGIQGEQGLQGDQGIQGIQGEPGPQGDQGPQGDPGAPGADALWNFTGAYNGGASYAVGDVATYDGKTWYRTNSNGGNVGDTPSEGLFWTLLADKGAQGDQGIQGEQGIQGIQGEPGPQGDQGIQGIQGDQGIQGIQGEQGIQGVQGEQGIPGETGPQGDPGVGVPVGGAAGDVLVKSTATDYDTAWSSAAAVATTARSISFQVKNDDSVTLPVGTPVYPYGADGTNILVRRAYNTADEFSSQVLGLLNQSLAPNAQGLVTQVGPVTGLNTSTAAAGDPVWLGATPGQLIYGAANKPYGPNHLVYLGTVTRSNINNGIIDVHISNGWELDELHNVGITGATLNNGDVLKYNSTTSLWVPGNAVWLGTSQNYFIDTTTGSNTTGDGTAARPWATLDNALSVTSAVTGTRIFNLGRGVHTSTTLASWPANVFVRGLGPALTTLSITGAVTLAAGWNSGSAGAPPVGGAFDLIISAASGSTFDFFNVSSSFGVFSLTRTTWAGAITYNASTASNTFNAVESTFISPITTKGPGFTTRASDFRNTVAVNEPNSTNLSAPYTIFFASGTLLRASVTVTVTANQVATVDMRNAMLLSNITVTGANAIFLASPATIRSTATITTASSGTIDYTATAQMSRFLPNASVADWTGQSANWNAFPETIYAALTELAARINALEP